MVDLWNLMGRYAPVICKSSGFSLPSGYSSWIEFLKTNLIFLIQNVRNLAVLIWQVWARCVFG